MIEPVTTTNTSAFSKFMQFGIPSNNARFPAQKNKIPVASSFDTLPMTRAEFPWVTNPIITSALDELKKVRFDENDVAYIKNLGVEPPFKSGQEAVDFIKHSNLRISFADTGAVGVHAQYDYSDNKILLNKKYQNTSDTADVLALAEAILHESGHAKDNDGGSSIQEELNNLGMGAIAHKYFEKKYPHIFNHANTPIVNDGVNIYAKIFFDSDSKKQALKERVRQKYGLLPAGDKIHPPTKLALEIKNGILN